jgi:hypothetical protein
VPLGLEHYNAGSHYVANYNAANYDTVLAGRIHALTTDRSGRVWAGSLEGGIQFFDRLDAPIFFDVPNTSNLSVRALEARGDTLYAMTTRDVRLYNRFTAAFIDSFLLPAAPVLSGHPLLVDSERTILVGTANGVRIRRPDGSISDLTTANSPLANDEVRAIREEPGTGAYWIATAGGLHRYDPNYVPPPPPPLPTLQFRIYPNPALLSAIGTSLRLSGNASSYEGEIYDLSGRLVNRFSAGASGQLMWNGRDTNGEVVPAGVYFLRVVAGSNTGFARIVLLH